MLNARKITDHLHEYGEHLLSCDVYIKRSIHDPCNKVVRRYFCALLNSGGGLLQLKNVKQGQQVQSKDLDIWWSGMETQLKTILGVDDICNYYDFIGDFDDQYLYLFVKTADHLCTVDYHALFPTDTATHKISYRSAMKLLTEERSLSANPLAELPPVPSCFEYGKTHATLKQETKRIQFKQLTIPERGSKTCIGDKIRDTIVRYISAFGNHEGGHIYFGIEDITSAVIGEKITQAQIEDIERKVTARMASMIWGNVHHKVIRGVHWDIIFYPVHQCPRQEKRYIVVVSVCRYPGGVFMSCPECFILRNRQVELMNFQEWRSFMLQTTADIPELNAKFMKLTMNIPNPKLVFTLPRNIQKIRDRLITVGPQPAFHPKGILDNLQSQQGNTYLQHLAKICDNHRVQFIAIAAHCWGLGCPIGMPESVACDLLLIGPTIGVHLVTLSMYHSGDLWGHSREIAAYVRFRLVRNGACSEKLGIRCHVVCAEDHPENLLHKLVDSIYPTHVCMNEAKFVKLLDALVLSMALYKRYPTRHNVKHYFTLTADQFELMWTRQFTKDLWIHGPPGSGKTLLSLQFISELRRRGAAKHQILYVTEQQPLADFVRSFVLCETVTRRQLLQEYGGKRDFRDICNVVVDEAQNFKDRDGDWYTLVDRLRSQGTMGHTGPKQSTHTGYFWLFLDYAGKVHKFAAGLPDVIGRNNFMLKEITRGTQEIFNFTKRYLTPAVRTNTQTSILPKPTPNLTHMYDGKKVKIIKTNQEKVKEALANLLETLKDSGVNFEDVAVLTGKSKDKAVISETVSKMESEEDKAVPMVETVKRFSGLERPVIIGLNLRPSQSTADYENFMLNFATRATSDLVIIASDDDMIMDTGDQD